MNDKRVPCKYGASCYQKNQLHHLKYKHDKRGNNEADISIPMKIKKVRNEEENLVTQPKETAELKQSTSEEKPHGAETEPQNTAAETKTQNTAVEPQNTAAETKTQNTAAEPQNTAAETKTQNTAAEPQNTAAEPQNTAAEPQNTAAELQNTAAEPQNTAAEPQNTAAEPKPPKTAAEKKGSPVVDYSDEPLSSSSSSSDAEPVPADPGTDDESKEPEKDDSEPEEPLVPTELTPSTSQDTPGVEETKQPSSPQKHFCDEKLREMFLVKMPDEFISFWEFCKCLCPSKPEDALLPAGLHLVGPFDVFTGILQRASHDEILQHSRYYFDPPEFQTLLLLDPKTQHHMGYFRDNPYEDPVFVASNTPTVDCIIKPVAPNLFTAVQLHLTSQMKTVDPFKRIKISKILTALTTWVRDHNIPLKKTSVMTARAKKVVCQTFHKAGMVTPFNKSTTVGYRQITTDDELRKLLDSIVNAENGTRRIEEICNLDMLINNAIIGNDEFDFGGSLELGINMFCYGHKEFHCSLFRLLRSTYALLGRVSFAIILKAHIQTRARDESGMTVF